MKTVLIQAHGRAQIPFNGFMAEPFYMHGSMAGSGTEVNLALNFPWICFAFASFPNGAAVGGSQKLKTTSKSVPCQTIPQSVDTTIYTYIVV